MKTKLIIKMQSFDSRSWGFSLREKQNETNLTKQQKPRIHGRTNIIKTYITITNNSKFNQQGVYFNIFTNNYIKDKVIGIAVIVIKML